MRLAYHRLDVFTDRPLTGNPLAVVAGADGLTSVQMQAIAREFNLSETVFILPPRESIHTARLRIFTPVTELPFAGHPTIGAACLIAQLRAPEMLGRAPLQLVLEEEIGPVCCDVTRYKGGIRASFIAPRLPQLGATSGAKAEIAAALGLTADEIGFDGHAPVVVASAGLSFAFIPLSGLAALQRVAPQLAALDAIFAPDRPVVCVYTRETVDPTHHVAARVFAFGTGVNEDPATGAAACAFAAVACAFERPEDGEHSIVIEQGFQMGRPSEIVLTMQVAAGELTQAVVGGASVQVGEGF